MSILPIFNENNDYILSGVILSKLDKYSYNQKNDYLSNRPALNSALCPDTKYSALSLNL